MEIVSAVWVGAGVRVSDWAGRDIPTDKENSKFLPNIRCGLRGRARARVRLGCERYSYR